MPDSPFVVDPVLTGIALSYRNKVLIADQVLPRLDPPLSRSTFKYSVLTKEEGFTVPDTKVGRRGKPNQVGFSSSEVESSTEDYGLDDPIPMDDITQAQEGYDPVQNSAEALTNLVALDREKRVAGKVFAAATYPVGNKATLAGGDQWSDTVNSDPVVKITDALDVPIIRPNSIVLGRKVLTALSRHPKILKSVHGNSGDSGVASRQAIADLFELDNIFVGSSFFNTVKKGQTAAYSRVWGKHCALLYLDPLARGDQNRISFGMTFQYGTKVAGQKPDGDIGLRGGIMVRVGESVKEVITASDLGYLFTNAIL